MKRIVPVMLMVSLVSLVGCGSKQHQEEAYVTPSQAVPENVCMPEWQLTPPTSLDGFYSAGQAQYSNPSLATDTADARARQAIARVVETKTAGIVNSFMRESGVGESRTLIDFAESITKNITVVSLQGAIIERRHVCPDGTVYSLAFYPYETYRNDMVESASTSAHNGNAEEQALAANFFAQEALGALDAEIDKAFPQ